MKTLRNKNLVFAIVILLIASLAFFSGMKYQEQKSEKLITLNSQNRNFGTRGFQAFRGTTGGNRAAYLPISGEIINRDNESVTVKLQDGSSKIVVLSENTLINKSDKGSSNDLKKGEKIVVIGKSNADGSVTATVIQLNPTLGTWTQMP